MSTFASRLSLVLCLGLISIPAADANWPQWRGTDGNMVGPAGDYPVDLAQPESLAWQVDLGGDGSSTPIVWGDNVYVTLAAEGQDTLACYDLRTGDERWRKSLDAARPAKHRNGTSCNSSPVTDGQHVVVYFKSGMVACFTLDGDLMWEVNLQRKYGKDTLWWDLGTSPVLTSAGVCIAVMQAGDSYLVTLDLENGEEVWKQQRQYDRPQESDQSYTTPTVVDVDGRETVVTWGADHLTGHDAKTGELIWECGGFNPENKGMWRVIASAGIGDGIAVLPYGRTDFLAGIRLGGAGDTTDQSWLWNKQGVGTDVPSPVIADGKVYVLGDSGEVTCLDLATGNVLWTDRLPRAKSKYYSSPLLAGSTLYCLREDGMLYAATIDDGLQVVGEKSFDETAVATPVPIDDSLLIRTRTRLYRVGAAR